VWVASCHIIEEGQGRLGVVPMEVEEDSPLQGGAHGILYHGSNNNWCITKLSFNGENCQEILLSNNLEFSHVFFLNL